MTPTLSNQKVPGHRDDTVLRDKDYHTPQGTVIDGYGAMVECRNGKSNKLIDELLRRNFDHNDSGMKSPGIELLVSVVRSQLLTTSVIKARP
jgi:hypothetical protein